MFSIGILDVGIGNIPAIEGSYRRLNIQTTRISTYNQLKLVNHLIIPGVGNMSEYMSRLRGLSLDNEIKSFSQYGYILGICLGFQALFEFSEEGDTECLGILNGHVKRIFDISHISTNIGFLTISPKKILEENSIKNQLSLRSNNNTEYYFTHSFYVEDTRFTTHLINNSQLSNVSAACSNFSNIFGTQFHPELSHSDGLHILSSFSLLGNQ